MGMKTDLAGLLHNVANHLEPVPLDEPAEDGSSMWAFVLREVAGHIQQVRNGDEDTVKQFRDLYGLNPGDMLWDRSAAE